MPHRDGTEEFLQGKTPATAFGHRFKSQEDDQYQGQSEQDGETDNEIKVEHAVHDSGVSISP